MQRISLHASIASVFDLFSLLYPNGAAEIGAFPCRTACEQRKGTVPAITISRDRAREKAEMTGCHPRR